MDDQFNFAKYLNRISIIFIFFRDKIIVDEMESDVSIQTPIKKMANYCKFKKKNVAVKTK